MPRSNISFSSSSRHNVIALCVALAANACGHTFVLIVMPTLGRQLGFSDIETGLLIGLSALLLALSGPVWGMISDRKGRRKVLLLALVSAASFPPLLALISQMRLADTLSVQAAFLLLLASRIGQVCLSGGLMPAAQAWLADQTTAQNRAGAMALMGAAFGFGSIIGGSFAWQMGGNHLIFALCLIAIMIILGVIWLSQVMKAPTDQSSSLQEQQASHDRPASGHLSIRSLLPFLIITLCGLATYGLLHQVTPLRFQDAFGLSSTQAIAQSGKTMSLTVVGMVLMQFLVARKLGWSPARLLNTGAVGALIALIAAALAPTIIFLSGATILLGISLGILIPGNLASLSLTAGPSAQARAAGTNAVAQGIGMAIGPIAGAALHQLSPLAPYGLAIGLFALVCIIALFTKKKSAFAV